MFLKFGEFPYVHQTSLVKKKMKIKTSISIPFVDKFLRRFNSTSKFFKNISMAVLCLSNTALDILKCILGGLILAN